MTFNMPMTRQKVCCVLRTVHALEVKIKGPLTLLDPLMFEIRENDTDYQYFNATNGIYNV